MRLLLNTHSIDDYTKFLRAKELPKYKVTGRTLTPTAYICRYWKWRDANAFCPAGRWNLHTSMFCRLRREDVDKEASELIAEGCRNVTIIKIEGD